MHAKEIDLVGKIGQFVSHFPVEWQDHQGWLRDIIASRNGLRNRYPVWQAALIFHWRLFYFVVYIASIVVLTKSNFFVESLFGNVRVLFEKTTIFAQFILRDRARYLLQRIATLLAVAELTLCGIAALTGILLAFYYQPAAMGAYASLQTITNDVAHGTLMLSLHNIAGNGLIVVALVQLVVLFLGREFLLAWFASWISGILLTLSAIGLSWTAIVLNWDQVGFWRFKLELSTVASLPLVGTTLRDVLAGGGGINSVTLQHMYTLHGYLFAIAAILLSISHLLALILQEQHWKAPNTPLNLAKLDNNTAPNTK